MSVAAQNPANAAGVAPLRGLVPIAHVADVRRAIDFYVKLGFRAESTLAPQGQIVWAWLRSGNAHLMVTRSLRPRKTEAQDVLFYLYARDVVKYREQLAEQGVTVGPLTHPPYMMAGEFPVTDPDGYSLLIGEGDADSM